MVNMRNDTKVSNMIHPALKFLCANLKRKIEKTDYYVQKNTMHYFKFILSTDYKMVLKQ